MYQPETTSDPTPSVTRTPTLIDAWKRFATYDQNAVLAQRNFLRQRKWIVLLGVASTTLAVVYSVVDREVAAGGPVWFPTWLSREGVKEVFHLLVGVTPIILTVMIAVSVKFNLGISWVMLRSSAEALRKEIYCYRTQVGEYSPRQTTAIETREVKLARRLKLVSKRLMETAVNQTGLKPYKDDMPLPPKYGTAPDDDGFSDLTAEQYLHWRLEDQFDYYQKKALKLDRELKYSYWQIYILGGFGALLALLRLDVWIAVSSAVAAALTTFLEFRRVESNIVSCNLAAADLYDIRVWWNALPDIAKQDQASIETLVSSTESVMQTENSGWLQEMRDALAEIYSEKKKEEAADKAKAEAITTDRSGLNSPPVDAVQTETDWQSRQVHAMQVDGETAPTEVVMAPIEVAAAETTSGGLEASSQDAVPQAAPQDSLGQETTAAEEPVAQEPELSSPANQLS